MALHAPAPADVPAARSAALVRRLRKRRQEARIRARLACDGAILLSHHASMPPSAPPAQPGQPASESLRAQVATLQAKFDALLAMVESMQQREVPPDDVGSVGSLDGSRRLAAAESEEARLVESQASVEAAEEERMASAVAVLLSAIESRQVESLQLAIAEAEAAGVADVWAAKYALGAEQRKASAQVALSVTLQCLEDGTLEGAVRQGLLAGFVVAGFKQPLLDAALTAMSRVEILVASAKEASALALAVLATDRCRSCLGRGSTLVDVCLVCRDKPRRDLVYVLKEAENVASKDASARLVDLVVAATGASPPELEVVATGPCQSCLGSGLNSCFRCFRCQGTGLCTSYVMAMVDERATGAVDAEVESAYG